MLSIPTVLKTCGYLQAETEHVRRSAKSSATGTSCSQQAAGFVFSQGLLNSALGVQETLDDGLPACRQAMTLLVRAALASTELASHTFLVSTSAFSG